MIPSKGAELITDDLFEAARHSEHCIVEVGCWLGAATYHLARGAEKGNNVPIYIYGWFEVQESEIQWAKKQGVNLKQGQDTTGIIRDNVGYDNLHLIKCNVSEIRWKKKSIGVYVDDAGKQRQAFKHKINEFEPYFVKGAKLFFMDSLFWKKTGSDKHKYQYNYVNRYYQLEKSFDWRAGQLYIYP